MEPVNESGSSSSDERLREEIKARLAGHDLLDASEIEVEVRDGNVVLNGWVEDGDANYLAELLASDVSGATSLENHLRIKHPTEVTPGTFGSIEDLSANYSQKVYGNPVVAMGEEADKADALSSSAAETGGETDGDSGENASSHTL
jgi:hypothetical protein